MMSTSDPAIRRVAILLPQIAKNLRAPILLRLESVRHGLTTPQLVTLLLLGEAEEASLSMSELAGELGITLPTATGLVDRLVREKLVVRKGSDEDRRVVLVTITREGSAVIRRVRRVLDDLLTRLLSSITEAERESVAQAAERVFELSVMIREEERDMAAGIQEEAAMHVEVEL
jgi:DNA-binding MarR family transcriptional regulator